MRYLVLYQTEVPGDETLSTAVVVEAADADTALSTVDDYPRCAAVEYALLIHDGSPIPDVYDHAGDPLALSDAPTPEDAASDEPDPEPDEVEEPAQEPAGA